MPVDLYISHGSSPCRAVLMACEAAGIKTNLKELDLRKKEQMSDAYLKINPNHTVPTIVDDSFILWESRPIAAYLIDKYAPDHWLYPMDLQKRALIQRMLCFDLTTVYKAIGSYVYPQILEGKPTADPTEMETMFRRLNDETFSHNKYAVGDEATLADLFLVATVTFPELVGYEIDQKMFPNLVGWIRRVKQLDFYERGNLGYERLKAMVAQRRALSAPGK